MPRFTCADCATTTPAPGNFYTVETAVRGPADLSGLKIRVQKSITSTRMVQALGGSATPIDWGELYSALQQGVGCGVGKTTVPSTTRALLPFYAVMILVLFLVVYLPSLSEALPRMIGY